MSYQRKSDSSSGKALLVAALLLVGGGAAWLLLGIYSGSGSDSLTLPTSEQGGSPASSSELQTPEGPDPSRRRGQRKALSGEDAGAADKDSLMSGVFTLQVKDEHHAPLHGVEARFLGAADAVKRSDSSGMIEIDATGKEELQEIQLQKEGYYLLKRWVPVSAGASLAITMEKAMSIKGIVTLAGGGEPAPGATVACWLPMARTMQNSDGQASTPRHKYLTEVVGDDGLFEFLGLIPRQRYSLCAFRSGSATPGAINGVVPSEDETVALKLQPLYGVQVRLFTDGCGTQERNLAILDHPTKNYQAECVPVTLPRFIQEAMGINAPRDYSPLGLASYFCYPSSKDQSYDFDVGPLLDYRLSHPGFLPINARLGTRPLSSGLEVTDIELQPILQQGCGSVQVTWEGSEVLTSEAYCEGRIEQRHGVIVRFLDVEGNHLRYTASIEELQSGVTLFEGIPTGEYSLFVHLGPSGIGEVIKSENVVQVQAGGVATALVDLESNPTGSLELMMELPDGTFHAGALTALLIREDKSGSRSGAGFTLVFAEPPYCASLLAPGNYYIDASIPGRKITGVSKEAALVEGSGRTTAYVVARDFR